MSERVDWPVGIYTSHIKLSTGLFTHGVDSSRQKALFFFLLCGNQWWNLKQQCVSEPVSTGSVHEGLGDLVTAWDKKCKVAVTVPVLKQACWRHKMWKMKNSFSRARAVSRVSLCPFFWLYKRGLGYCQPSSHYASKKKYTGTCKLRVSWCD